jgi:hypothetical protein
MIISRKEIIPSLRSFCKPRLATGELCLMGAAPWPRSNRGTTMHAHYSLSGPQAGQLATQGRQLLRRGLLTPHQYVLWDTLLWGARKPGSATLSASLKALARLAGQGRNTVAEGIRKLEELGLLQRVRRRIRVAWLGGQASRQVANLYRLLPPDTESGARTANKQSPSFTIMEVQSGAVRAAQEALAARRKAFAERRTRVIMT